MAREWEVGRDRLSASLRAPGTQTGGAGVDYLRARARVPELNESFEELFAQRYDAIILTPAAAGTAPAGLDSTGNPLFCTLWTLCGMPAVSVPLMQGANGLPLGVQLVGPRHGDARLLRTAGWLVDHVAEAYHSAAARARRS